MGFYDDYSYTGGTAGNPSFGSRGSEYYTGGAWDPSSWFDFGVKRDPDASWSLWPGQSGAVDNWHWRIGDTNIDYDYPSWDNSSNRKKRDEPSFVTPDKKRKRPDDGLPPRKRPPINGGPSGGPIIVSPEPIKGPPSSSWLDPPQLIKNNYLGKMSGKPIHGFPGPFRTKRVDAILGEEMHETRKLYLKALKGRLIPWAKQKAANQFKPLTMLFGDILAKQNVTTVPTEEEMFAGGTTGLNKDNFDRSTTQVIWNTNAYGDVCTANCMANSSVTEASNTGVMSSVINNHFLLTNIWTGVNNGQTGNVRMSLPALAALNSSEYASIGVGSQYVSQLYPSVDNFVDESPAGLECLFRYQSETVVNNPMNYGLQVEVYLIVSKYETVTQTPNQFWDDSQRERAYEQHSLGANQNPQVLVSTGEQYRPPDQRFYSDDLSLSPTGSIAFNNRYRVLDKKTVVIGPGHTTKFLTNVPWSLVKRDVIGVTNSLPGVSHYLWMRFTSPMLYNNDSHALTNSCGKAFVQQFEKIQVKPIPPTFVPKIYNFITFPVSTSNISATQLINPDGNNVVSGGTIAMDM